MKIEFDEDNRSSIEFKRNNDSIYIIITAPSSDDINSLIVNSASISEKELNTLLKSINFEQQSLSTLEEKDTKISE